jgi:ABC-type sulfate transport system permease component
VKTERRLSSFGLKALVAIVLVLILQPLLYLVIRASEKSSSQILSLLTREKTIEVLVVTLSLLAIVVLVNVLLGTAIAAGLQFLRMSSPTHGLRSSLQCRVSGLLHSSLHSRLCLT